MRVLLAHREGYSRDEVQEAFAGVEPHDKKPPAAGCGRGLRGSGVLLLGRPDLVVWVPPDDVEDVA
ncbi:hypothetical protein KBZ21_41990, partial [Streptomyces sp. A73]|nr:hypothetical protein [Streptomyces sp. A73]